MVGNYTMVTFIKLLERPQDSLFGISIETKKSTEEVLADIETINEILKKNSYPEISVSSTKYTVPKVLVENTDELFELFHVNQISFTPEDRVKIIYLYTYSRKSFLSNNHYQEILHVSRNTVLSDINKVREELALYNIEFVYTRSKGYHLKGEEYDKHHYAFIVLSKLLENPIGEWTIDYILKNYLEEEPKITDLISMGKKYTTDNNILSIQNRLERMMHLLQFLLIRYKKRKQVIDPDSTVGLEQPSGIKTLARSSIDVILGDHSEMSEEDISFIELLLIGAYEKKIENEEEQLFFNQLADEIVTEMETVSLIQFENRETMKEGIKKHLIPAYYRLKLGFEDVNGYHQIIMEQYHDLFIIVKKALQPLQEHFIYKIPDSEIAYFVIHFGGNIQGETKELGEVNALIVCPHGISSSMILKQQLSQIFPNITFLRSHQLADVSTMDESQYDVIFSTVAVEAEKPVFVVPINLGDEDKKELYSLVYEEVPMLKLKPSPIDEIIEVTKKYSTILDEKKLRTELIKLIYSENKDHRKGEYPLLHELITADTFQHSSEKFEWKDAFRLASKPLLELGYIEDRYVDKMIDRVEEFGPFINLGKGVAIPHARPEDGVSELSMSMLVLDEPIYLPEDDKPVNILIVIAATDNETHLTALSHLTNILIADGEVEKMAAAKTYADIEEIIHQGGE